MHISSENPKSIRRRLVERLCFISIRPSIRSTINDTYVSLITITDHHVTHAHTHTHTRVHFYCRRPAKVSFIDHSAVCGAAVNTVNHTVVARIKYKRVWKTFAGAADGRKINRETRARETIRKLVMRKFLRLPRELATGAGTETEL